MTPAPNPMLTSSVARIGKTDNAPSATPRFSGTVTSVIHALNAASLPVEPINVITQSITITTLTVAATTAVLSCRENSRPMLSRLMP